MTRPARPRRLPVSCAVLLLAVLVATCGLMATPVGDILAKPADFEGREVTVSGDVRNVVKLPFLPGFYSIRDKSGEIVVLTDGAVPAEGASVRIRARVESAATIGGRALGVHLREAGGR